MLMPAHSPLLRLIGRGRTSWRGRSRATGHVPYGHLGSLEAPFSAQILVAIRTNPLVNGSPNLRPPDRDPSRVSQGQRCGRPLGPHHHVRAGVDQLWPRVPHPRQSRIALDPLRSPTMRNSVGCLIITSNPDRTVVDTDVSSLLKLAMPPSAWPTLSQRVPHFAAGGPRTHLRLIGVVQRASLFACRRAPAERVEPSRFSPPIVCRCARACP